ncbi:cache domain-containing protein [Maridesulfovibrio ferrireducens]|uniref:cache domain-containing protein n=1 Tax=Maridesulfovibrio ferrireducens TaxID=246191 RepID=UPI001A199256|nr:cache domain-containing protein [Maridesulfovibrio ferrireducens]MBI9109756.1 cache domain-containing protein [Maridesulfovibrio ferrireducens]
MKSIASTLARYIFTFCISSILIFGGIIFYFMISDYHDENIQTEEAITGSVKAALKSKMGNIENYINFSKNKARTIAKESIKAELLEAHKVALHLYKTYKDSMEEDELKGVIIEALRFLLHNNSNDHIFVLSMDGMQIMSSDQPELELTNVLPKLTPNGRAIIKETIELAQLQKEGFLEFLSRKPDKTGKSYQKITYIKNFAPFDWIIGAGQNSNSIKQTTQVEVLKRISQMHLNKDEYIFGATYDGLVLLGPGKDQNILKAKDSKGAEITQKLISKAKSGGGFLNYTVPSIDANYNQVLKISYCLPVTDWNWYLGSGSNISLIEQNLKEKKEELFEKLLLQISAVCVLFFLFSLAVVFFTDKFKQILTDNFNSFENFFRKGTDSPVKINQSKIAFKEFDQMAVLANKMIDSREAARKELLKSEITYREIFNATKDAIGVLDIEQRVFIDINQAFLDFFGLERMQAIGMTPETISFNTPPYDNKYAVELFKKALLGEAVHFEWMVKNINGEPFWTDNLARVATIGGKKRLLIVMRDITERKKMQEIMIQTEKMMSVGGLAAGMAHEINNPLGVILQVTQNIIRRTSPELPGNIPVAEECGIDLVKLQHYMEKRGINYYLSNIQDAGTRAATIIRSMLDFSRKSNSAKVLGNIETVIENALSLAANDYDLKKQYDFKKINLIREYNPLPLFNFTEMEISQVILNLIKNAAQALSENYKTSEIPTITIRTSMDKNSVRIEIEDNGPGLSDKYLKRIFEPFYSSKAPGAGTGLGLSVSYFIITHNHGGTITADSNPGEGTRFTVTLPIFTNQ